MWIQMVNIIRTLPRLQKAERVCSERTMWKMLFREVQDFMSMATKYHNKKTTIDDIIFDSKAEANYYLQLKWLKDNKQILFFRLQPSYLLQEAFDKDGKKFRRIDYKADFEAHHLDGSIEVIDVKGIETEAFKIKRKLFEYKYPHKLSLITYSEQWGGWIELDKLKKLKKGARKVDKTKKETKVGASVQKRTRAKSTPVRAVEKIRVKK